MVVFLVFANLVAVVLVGCAIGLDPPKWDLSDFSSFFVFQDGIVFVLIVRADIEPDKFVFLWVLDDHHFYSINFFIENNLNPIYSKGYEKQFPPPIIDKCCYCSGGSYYSFYERNNKR